MDFHFEIPTGFVSSSTGRLGLSAVRTDCASLTTGVSKDVVPPSTHNQPHIEQLTADNLVPTDHCRVILEVSVASL